MIISTISFLIFISCIIVITSYSPVTSVVYLIATFILTAIYLSSQNIIYIALTYIIVYVGAVITLFLFVVIMINLGTEMSSAFFTQTIPLTIVTVTFYTILIVSANTSNIEYDQMGPMIFQIITHIVNWPDTSNLSLVQESLMTSITGNTVATTVNHWNQIQSIAFELYTHKAIWLVLVSIVLMISIVGPIVICKKYLVRSKSIYL